MQITPHFNLREFTFSETAARMGREVVVLPEHLMNIKSLCAHVLEPIRVMLGRPMVITSGYRPPWLNKAVGGSDTSTHMTGGAADIQVVGMSALTFSRWVEMRMFVEGWPIDQLILEYGRWTHIATTDKPRGQVLTARKVDGKTRYLQGILA